jgi:cellulose synthase/poly-beta-1,6-N-acetylglucosamine synthase-like glycosyltransferase
MITVLQVIYGISALGLALIGFNALALSIVYLWHRRERPGEAPPLPENEWPAVVVQLPVYNERYVVERLVDAVSKLDYPHDRLVIQLLDDSTDETVKIAADAVERARQAGVQFEHIRRGTRAGYKAGALAYGLEKSDAQFVAIFDADFVPEADFLRRVIPYFSADERLGIIQTRWTHLNADDSPLTRAQALALDAHFVVEQTSRNRGGLLSNFSGTAGVWRRTCIEDSGGWQHDTLSEDIDLSYRAQLKGWRLLYLPEVTTPAEIPSQIMAFKRQQARWATGTIQCLRKHGLSLLRARLSFWQKLEALYHLGGYFVHPLMILLVLTTLPMMVSGHLGRLPLTALSFAVFGPPLEIVLAQMVLHRDWPRRLVAFPVLMLLGIGIAVSNTRAIFQAFSGRPQVFERTPKLQILRQGRGQTGRDYVLPVDHTLWFELGLAVYAGVTGWLSFDYAPTVAPFMLLYALGFMYVAVSSLWQARSTHMRRASRGRFWGLSSTGGR